MPRSLAYEPVLSDKAASFLVGASRSRQKIIITLARQIAEHPSQLGDYASRDEIGREIQHLHLADWLFSFWPDHSARELRFTEIVEL